MTSLVLQSSTGSASKLVVLSVVLDFLEAVFESVSCKLVWLCSWLTNG